MAHLQKDGELINIHNRESESVSSLIPSQMRGEAQVFIAFLEDYYKYLNQEDQATNLINRIATEHDIDFTGDSFLEEIRKEIAKGIPDSQALNNRQLFRRIVDYYYTRGSENSATVFFKLFFNDSATITYPKETLFKTSDGAIEEFGFVENNGDNVGKLVRYSTVTGDFVEEKNTQAPAGLKPIQITTTDGNTSFNFVDGTYKFNFTNNRYEKEGQPQQFFIFNQALSRWEFVRNVYSFYYGYDNRGIIGEGNDNLIPATEKEGFWKVLSDGTTNNQSFWTFRASQTAGHPDYLVDINGTPGNPTPGNDIRNESPVSSSFPLTNMARAVTTGEVFVTEDILVDSDHENEYFCHNSNLKDTFWTYDKANVSEDKNLKFHIELIREKKNHIRYPLTHWATDRTTVRKATWNTETGYQGADESGFKYLDDFHIGAFGINQEQVHTTKLVSSAVSRRHQINFPSEIKRTHKLTITQNVDSTKIDVTLDEGSMHDLTPNGKARLDRDCYFIYRDGVELAQLSTTLSKSNVVGNKCRLTFGADHTSLNFATGQKIEIHQRIGEFKPNKRYVFSGTISILAEGNGSGTPGGTEGFAPFLGLSNATQGFNHSTSSGSEHVAQSLDIVGGNTTGNVFIKDPDNTAANKRGLAINSGETTVGDFEVVFTKDDTTSGVLTFVSNNSTPYQIDNLRLVEEKTNDEFPTGLPGSTVDRDAEYEYHPDYDKDKQAALFINAGDFDASFTSEFSQLQHNDVLSSEKVSSQAEIAATASSARSFKICREINKFPLMTRFTTVANNVWDTGTYGYRVPDSDHPTPSAAVSAKYNFKVTRLKRNAKINQSDFTVNNFSNVTLTLDNKSGGNLEVGQTVSGGKIRRGSVIESISAQAGSTATIVISPQITHVFRVLSDSNANTVKVELIEGSLDCIDGTLGTNLECQKNGSAFGGTAVISAPTNIVQVGLSRRVTCTLNFNSAQNVTAGDKLEFVKHHTIYDNTVLRFADVTLQLRDSESAINVTAGEGIRTTGLGTNQHRLAIDVSDLALRWPGEDFQLGTYENDTIIYGKDSKGVVTTLMEKANFPTRKVTSSTASAFDRISIPDKTILLSNGKGFGVGNNGHDNAVLPLNNYGKEFGFHNYRSDNKTHLQGYALDNAKIEFYEIEIPTEIGWERASNSFDLYAEQLFLFGPEAQPTKIIRGPTASLSDARTDTDLGNGGRKLRYKYEVLKGGNYSSVINQFTGIIQRDGKTIPPNERTALRVGDIFVGQPGDTGEKRLPDNLLVKPAPSEILNVKSGDYFSITPRGGVIPRNALLDNDVSPSGQRANRNYFYIIKSSGNVVASISSGGNIVDNIVLSPASNRILQRSSFGTDYTLSGLSYDKGSGNGRDSNGTEIRTAQTKFNYENSQTGTISRNVFKLNANVTNATALVCSSSGGANHDGATTDAGPLYTGQYLRVATGYIINGVDNTNTASIATLKGHIRAGMRVEMLASNVTLSNSSTPITISSVSDYVNAGENNSTATIGLSQDITITGSNIYVEFYTQITNIADRGTAVTNALTSANVTVSPAITTTGTNGSSQLALGLYYGGLISGDANRFVFKTSKAPLYSQGGWVPVKDAALYSGSTATHTILNQYANNRVYLDNALTNREHGDTDTYIHKLKSAIVLTLPGTSHYVYHYFGAEKRGRVRQLTPRTLSGTTGIPLYNPNDDDLEFFATDSVFQVYYDTSAQGHLNSTISQDVASATKRISFNTTDDAKRAARKGKIKVGMFADFGSYAGIDTDDLPLVVTAVHDDGDFDLTSFASEVAWYITTDAPLVEFYTPGEQTFENTNLILRDKTQAYVNFTGVTRGKTDTYYVESMLEPAFSQSFADGSGGDGTSHVPVEKCKDTYVVPHKISDWSAYTTYSNSWNVYYWDSGWRLYQTHSRPFARGGAVQSQFIPVGGPASGSDAFITATAQDGGTITPNLWKFEGERPFALFVNDEENDEELVYGFNRNTYNQLSYNFYSDYENRKGRISDVNKIHDGNFNQEFSYGLNTGVSLDKWEAEYRKLVHPSGLKFFALLSVEPKVLRTANGSATYELTIGDDWLNNLQLPVGQHSPTFQPGWLDEVLTSVVDIEPLVQAGATLQDATNIVEQILASTYVLSSAKSNGITTITLTTKFVETETLIQMKTTNLTSFPKPIGIRSEDLEAAGLSRSQVTLSQTIEDSPGIFKAARLGNRETGGSESAPTSLTYDTTADGHIITLKINGGTAVSTGSSALNRSAAINQIRIRNGLVSGRKYKVTGQIKVTHNSLTNNADLDVGADIGDAYVTENPGGSNRNTSSQGTNGLYFRTLAAGAVDSDFVSFEVTGTHSSTYPGGSGDGSRNFVDINVTAQSNGDSTMNLSNIQVQFKNLKIQEFYTTNEKIIFNNSFDTKVTRGKTNPGTNRTDSFGNFTSWHNQINSYDSGNATFVDYQPLDVPRGANVRAEIINLKPISNNTETTWSKADAANLYGVPQTDFPTTVDFNFD
jgi:hypothetical protein